MKYLKLFENFINEALSWNGNYNQWIKETHLETDPVEFSRNIRELSRKTSLSKFLILSDLEAYRKEIGMAELGDKPYPKKRRDKELESERLEKERLRKEAAAEKRRKSWNKRKYDKWIKDMASGGDSSMADYGYEMAQNAQWEPGLIEYVRNMIRREGNLESPLERIQWDIEAHLD